MFSQQAKEQSRVRAAQRAITGRLMDRATIHPGHISPGNSPFLKRFPREIRDRIYEELLIVRRDRKDQDQYDKVQCGFEAGAPEWQCEVALDIMDQDYIICPDLTQPNKGAKSIAPNLGILLANKQIWDEATDVLFGKNQFGACPQAERVDAFWRCSIFCQDIPRHRPCQVRPETAIKIKHLFILVGLPDESATPVRNVKTNLNTIADSLVEFRSHFYTLKIRYWGQFSGEVEAVRDGIEGPLHPLIRTRPPVMIRHCGTGKFHSFRPKDFDTKLFKNIKVLESLKKLKHIADHVDIRGDLPGKYIAELTKILAVTDAPPPAIRAKRAKAAVASKQPKNTGGIQDFAAEMLAKDPNMEPGARKLYEDLMRTSRKSPAVMAKIFPELYDPSRHMSEMPPPPRRRSAATAHATPAVPNSAPDGGIGVLNGKPIFGPARPPSTD